MTQELYAAVDIDGTRIATGLLDPDGAVAWRTQQPTPPQGTAAAVMAVLHGQLSALAADPRWHLVRGLGIASPGPIDIATGRVSPITIPGWRSFPLAQHVRDHPALAARPELAVTLMSDGVAMAAGEHRWGAARDYDNVLCMVVSAGVSAGLVLDGVVRTGLSGNAGLLGHMCVELNGAYCPCGSRGCLELVAGGPAIVRRALRLGWTPPPGVAPSPAAVAVAARAGDRVAVATFDGAAQALAAGIAATAALVDMEAVVIGGDVADTGETLFAPLRRQLEHYACLSIMDCLMVGPAALGADAGLIGAAAIAASDAVPKLVNRSNTGPLVGPRA